MLQSQQQTQINGRNKTKYIMLLLDIGRILNKCRNDELNNKCAFF